MISILITVLISGSLGSYIYTCLKKTIEKPEIKDTQLLIGYDKKDLIKYPIIIDMLITPHIFVCGLSGNGKTKMVEYAIKDKQVVLINVMPWDFKSIKTRRINNNDMIIKYLNTILNSLYYRQIPLYIVIDELLVLCMEKEIEKAITKLLAKGRHYNIYIIGISQIGTKESVKFKDLFNTRVCFRQVEESSYRTVLGYSPENTDLCKRKFYYYSDEIGKGYTYDI